MLISQQIYRPFKPKASEQVFEFKRAGSSQLYLDLSGDRRKPFAQILQGKVCWEGSGKPTEAISGTIGDYLYLNGLVFGPKVGFEWHEGLGGVQPLLGYGPPTEMAAGNSGDYYFKPSVLRYLGSLDAFDYVPQLYGPRGDDGWDSVIVGTLGNPMAITPLVGEGSPDLAIGNEGDYYVDTTSNLWFGPKTDVWPVGVQLVPEPYIDAGGPTGSLYIDTKSNLIYGPKVTTWDGLEGVYFYTSTKMSEVGSPGDYYLDVPNHLLYGPKVTRYWDGLEGFPEVEHLLVQGATPEDDKILASEQNFQGGYRCIPRVVTQPVYGKVTASMDQMGFDYTPPSKYWVGQDSFSYSLVNIFGQESDARCIYVTIGL